MALTLWLLLAACRSPSHPPVATTPLPSVSPLPPFAGVDRERATYVGSAICAACHPAAAEVWRTSAHAHARDTLRKAQRGYDPECLPCHQTGLGHPGGTTAREADPLDHVGCESCHGPGSAHVSAPASGYGTLPQDAAACIGCHNVTNSPDFEFDAYWRDVAHSR